MIRYLTAGESHGQCLVGILEGMPAGLSITETEIAADLQRRQQGYGRGDRMKIEQDHALILSGVRYGKTLGSPIALLIENRDWENWREKMSVGQPEAGEEIEKLTRPRPGHADLAGALKYSHDDIRNVIERSSARETAMRVALGAICRKLLREFGIEVASHVVNIGGEVMEYSSAPLAIDDLRTSAERSPVRCIDKVVEARMIARIDAAKEQRDTLGGVFEVVIDGLPIGLGSYVHGDRRIDGVLAQAMLSIHAMKAVEFGLGAACANRFGSELHDTMSPSKGDIPNRGSNNAGGIEGGMTNGEQIRIRVTMKPLATLGKPLASVDMQSGKSQAALSERSDVCAVPAAGIVGEAMALLALMNPFLEKFGGDSMKEIRVHFDATPDSPWR